MPEEMTTSQVIPLVSFEIGIMLSPSMGGTGHFEESLDRRPRQAPNLTSEMSLLPMPRCLTYIGGSNRHLWTSKYRVAARRKSSYLLDGAFPISPSCSDGRHPPDQLFFLPILHKLVLTEPTKQSQIFPQGATSVHASIAVQADRN